jgi:hypothetical protein
MVYTLSAVSDANGPGFSSGSASVPLIPQLSAVVVSPAAPAQFCVGSSESAPLYTVSTGGVWQSLNYQWGYRTVSGGPITPFPGKVVSLTYFGGSSFPGPGSYLVVATVTQSCGSPMVSNEVPMTVLPLPDTPVINAPVWVAPGAANQTASVAAHAGGSFYWLISNGSITGGDSTNQVTFTAGTKGDVTLSVYERSSAGCWSPEATATVPITAPTSFYAVTPCRQLDTRTSGRPVASQSTLVFPLVGAPCSIPSTAKSVSVNVTVTQQSASGDLSIYPEDQLNPGTTTLSFSAAKTRANNAFLLLSSEGLGEITVLNNSPGPVHLIIDVNGYFQ